MLCSTFIREGSSFSRWQLIHDLQAINVQRERDGKFQVLHRTSVSHIFLPRLEGDLYESEIRKMVRIGCMGIKKQYLMVIAEKWYI